MNKRYQVFVSSTYEDLKNERLEVMTALLELDCIPCGMEYFPAANEDQWTFIKNLIDTCDYYVVIIGGCYGSMDSEGKSYTQKEYEYALSNRIPTIGFIHHDRESLPPEKKDTVKEKLQKLEEFIELVKSKLCKRWSSAPELGAFVSRSLTQLMKSYPRTGWVRADKIGSEEILEEVNKLRKENDTLNEQKLRLEGELSFDIDSDNIAYEEIVVVHGTYLGREYGREVTINWQHNISWKDLFVLISPYLMQWYNEVNIQTQTASTILKIKGLEGYRYEKLDKDILQSIKVQFLALGLIQLDTLNTVGGGTGLFWTITKKGKKVMLNERSVKKRALRNVVPKSGGLLKDFL